MSIFENLLNNLGELFTLEEDLDNASNMTRYEAQSFLFSLVGQGKLNDDEECRLCDIAERICTDNFTSCPAKCMSLCDGVCHGKNSDENMKQCDKPEAYVLHDSYR